MHSRGDSQFAEINPRFSHERSGKKTKKKITEKSVNSIEKGFHSIIAILITIIHQKNSRVIIILFFLAQYNIQMGFLSLIAISYKLSGQK